MNEILSEQKSPRQSSTSAEIYGSFFLNSGEFALPVQCIQEVVNCPASFTLIPLAPTYLCGVFNLRGSIIPVVDLKVILKLERDLRPLETKKIGIVEHQGIRIGLLFDSTGEIFRNHAEDRSEYDYANRTKAEVVAGAIKLDQGKRIVQILNIFGLLNLENVPRSNEKQGDRAEQRRKRDLTSRKQCITFVVGTSRCAFGIDAIHEIIKTPVLKESAMACGNCIGLLELRGDVIPVIDFAALLKYREVTTSAQISEAARVLVMKVGNEKFGLLIESVDSIVTYYAEELLSLPSLNAERGSMFLGCLSKPDLGDIIVLDQNQILSTGEVAEITLWHSKIYQETDGSRQATLKKSSSRKTYITFRVENLLALEINEVREIIEYPRNMMRPPGLAKAVSGILNLRGKIVTILDPRLLYGSEVKTNPATSKVLIFEKSGVSFGLIVDTVENIISVSDDDKMKLPESLYRAQSSSGIGADVKFAVEIEIASEKRAMLILDLDPLIRRLDLASSSVA